RRSLTDKIQLQFQRRIARPADAVFFIDRFLHRPAEERIKPPQFRFRRGTQIHFHRGARRNRVDARAAFHAADVESRARISRDGIRGETRDRTPECVHRVWQTEVAPRMTTWSTELDAITSRAERAISNSIYARTIET